MNLSEICILIYLWQEFSLSKAIFAGVGVLFIVRILLHIPRGQFNAYISQAAKDIRRSWDTLIGAFERVETYFQRLEIYAEVPPTTEMMDAIIRITIEVVSILGLATNEIKQVRISG